MICRFFEGVRKKSALCPLDKKNTYTYKSFSEKVVDQWSAVKEKCSTAMLFEQEVKRILMDDSED